MSAFGFRRAAPDLDPAEAARSIEAQGVAIAGACAQHRLELISMYTESHAARDSSSVQWRALFRDLRAAGEPPVVVLPSLRVLAERASDRLVRALQLRASGARVLLASGEEIDRAMREAWDGRGPEDRHAERVREGMQRRALRGLALGRPPFGYRVVDHRLLIEPVEAELVREIVRLYLDDDLGVRRIAALLNDRGLTTRLGRPWSATAVRDILRNPAYLGTSRRLGVIVPHAHEPILTRPDFEQIQRRMSRRRTAPAEQQRHEYLLSGLARCGYCGNRLIGVRRPGSDGDLVYYQCESATNQGRCGYHTRHAAVLEREVHDRLAAVSPGAAPVRASADEEAALESRRRTLHRQIEHALTAWTANEWNTARLLAEGGQRALADIEIEAALEELRGRRLSGSTPSTRESHRRLVEEWDSLEFAERRSLLRRLVGEIVVTDSEVRLALAT
jgi:hypothetical protein